jgi:hypothetical protein
MPGVVVGLWDDNALWDDGGFWWDNAQLPPVIDVIADQAVHAGRTQVITLSATGDLITYTLDSAPAFVTITGDQLRIAPLVEHIAAYTITVIATNAHGSDTTTFALSVLDALEDSSDRRRRQFDVIKRFFSRLRRRKRRT